MDINGLDGLWRDIAQLDAGRNGVNHFAKDTLAGVEEVFVRLCQSMNS